MENSQGEIKSKLRKMGRNIKKNSGKIKHREKDRNVGNKQREVKQRKMEINRTQKDGHRD